MKKNIMWRAAVGGALLTSAVPLSGVVAPAQAAPEAQPANVHDVSVVKLVGRGDYAATDAQMLHRIDQAVAFLRDEAGAAASFVEPTRLTELASQSPCNDSTAMRAEAEALFPDRTFDSTSGHHLVLLMPESCRTGNASGTIGSGLRSGGYVVAGMGADSADEALTFVHELGHNLGLQHANGSECTPAAGCKVTNYLDRYSSMGVGVTGAGYLPRPLDSYERTTLGLADGAEVADLTLPSDRRVRTFDVALRGRGTDSGLRGARLTDPLDGSTYYLDFHNGLGREVGTYIAGTGVKKSGNYFNKGVTVQHLELDAKGTANTVLQPAWSDGTLTRYALVDQEGYTSPTGGITVAVSGMDLTGSTADTARLHITLTNPNVPLGDQTGTITITAKGAVGSTVTATTAGWADASLSPVQWRDNGALVATGPSYTLPAGSDGHAITAEVTGTRESFKDETATSNTLVVGRGVLTDGVVYAIRSQMTGQVLATPGTPTGSGTQVVLQAFSGAPTVQQEWRAVANQDGSFVLKNAGTGRCLDNAAASTKDGARTIEWFCHGGSNQNWRPAGSGSGYTLVNAGSSKATTAGADGAMSQLDPGTVFIFDPVG